YVQAVVRGMTTGSALPRLQLDDLLDIEVPLPALDAQLQYGELIARRVKRRRQLAAELASAPVRELEVLVEWLEGGLEPSFDRADEAPMPMPQFERYRLPPNVSGPRRGRGRPSAENPAHPLLD